jgi:hypothetical protein
MTAGRAELRAPILKSLFLARPSRVTLAFVATETFEFEILAPGEQHGAHACERCGTFVITGEPWLP